MARIYLFPNTPEPIASLAAHWFALGYSIVYARGRLRLVRQKRSN